MADKYPTPVGKPQPATSLLLSPPNSGFSFDDLSNNALFLPIAQTNPPTQQDVGEADTFVGQPQTTSEPASYVHAKPTPNPYSRAAAKLPEPPTTPPHPVDRSSGSSASILSNLHMPLRAVEPANTQPERPKSAPTHHQQPPLSRTPSIQYAPVQHHWFYCREIEKKRVWIPFSLIDSVHLEEVLTSAHNEDVVVHTDGGRYDVHLTKRMRYPVFWEEDPTPVRRCSWFYRGDGEKRNIPYEEHFAAKLEEEYRTAMLTNTWYRRLEFPGGETIIIHNPSVIVHFLPTSTPDEWGNSPQDDQLRPRVVKRGVEDFDNIEDGEAMQIDHLVFVVHGIGGFCDLKFRTVTEVVDDFRSIGNNLLHTHFRKHVEDQAIGRVEFLPISWHKTLHGDNTGIDNRLQPITLPSIPKLRYFSNDTILDVLFYTSPVYCQTIVNQVASEINRMYALFLERNSTFEGNVSLVGHSLGSVILFDVLLHQAPDPNDEDSLFRDESVESEFDKPDEVTIEQFLDDLGLLEYLDVFNREKIDMKALLLCTESDLKDLELPLGPRKKLSSAVSEKLKQQRQDEELSNQSSRPSLLRRQSMSTVNYMVGLAGTGQPFISYPKLDFSPSCFFALGSPTSMFLTVRGLNTIGTDFKLPTCGAYFNIFHPFDPVAYRMEPLVDPNFNLKPVLIPHHKGRKRMHLEIKESLARVGSDLKQILMDSLKSTWDSINEFARAHRSITAEVEAQMDKYASDQLKSSGTDTDDDEDDDGDFEIITPQAAAEMKPEERIGNLNGGRRFDFVLQEKPIESFNEYLFALQSHMCYWESEDTVLLLLSEIYSTLGITPTIPYHRPIFPQPDLTNWLPSQPSTSSTRVQPPPAQTPKPPQMIQNSGCPQFPPFQTGQVHSTELPPPAQGYPFQRNAEMPALGANEMMPIPMMQGTFGPDVPPVTTLPASPTQQSPPGVAGMDPTLPIASNASVGPPPLSGFVRQGIKK